MVISNELPQLGDASAAIAGRFVVLLLTRSWLGKEDHDARARAARRAARRSSTGRSTGSSGSSEQGRFTRPSSTDEAIIALSGSRLAGRRVRPRPVHRRPE